MPNRMAVERSSRIATALALFAAGIVMGLATALGLGGEFVDGLMIVAFLCLCVSLTIYLGTTASHRIAASEMGYRAFFDHAVEGIFRTTIDGHYLSANQALADIYGYDSPRELIARLTDIAGQLYVEPKRRSEFAALMNSHGTVTGFVSEIYHRSGRRLWISENARAVKDCAGRLVCYEGTVDDVTEKIEQERALRAALRQAEIATKMKAAFLAAMSHELKSPLNAVLGFSEIIRDEVLGPVGHDGYREYAGDIHESGMRLLSVINDVLDVSRLEGGLLTIETRPVSAMDIAEQAIKLARNVTHDQRRIALTVASDMPLLLVDPRRLAQAIGNLLANALKFTPEKGEVRLVMGLDEDGSALLAVEDTGIGMARETIAAALEPFRQIDGSLARRFEGAGLGLSIAKALAELHGGALSVESALGEGTRVTISLPVCCLEAPSAKVA